MALTKISRGLLSTGVSDSSDATAITITSDEEVGIGTTSPAKKLNAVDSAALQAQFSGYSHASAANNARAASGSIRLGNGAGTTGLLLDYTDQGQTVGLIKNEYIADAASELRLQSPFLSFYTGTSASEAMRIDASGHLLVGTTSAVANSRLRVVSSGSSSSQYTCEMGSADGATQLLIRSDGAISLGMDSASPYNNTTGTGANAVLLSNGYLTRSTSSLRYKKDIADATWGLTEVKQLRPVTFKSNTTGEFADDKTYGGLIAEEVHALGLTEFVEYNDDDEPDALHYGNMVSLLTKAIQEQQDIIEDLKSRIETLEG